MRYAWMVCLLVVMAAAGSAQETGSRQAGAGEKHLGTWTGTWEGPSTGTFDLVMERHTDGQLKGRLTVTGGSTPYTAEFKALAIEGNALAATYDYPLDDGGEVSIRATLEDRSATGTWLLRAPGQGGEIASGTLALSRK